MAVRDDFAAGEVLAAADLNDTFASKPTFSYGTATPTADADGAIWYDENDTPPTPKFWDGSAWQPFSVGAADFSNAASGTYTDGGGQSWKYISFTASGTLTITKAGYAEIYVQGAGSGGADQTPRAGGGGGGARWGAFELDATSYTVTVGAGGAGESGSSSSGFGGFSGVAGIVSVAGGEPARARDIVSFSITYQGGGGAAGGAAVSSSAVDIPGAGAGGTLYGSNAYDGITINYDNTSTARGAGGSSASGNAAANSGNGGGYNAGNGGSGVVIVRVKV